MAVIDRVKLMVGRAVLRLVDDALRMQRVQVVGLAGEVLAEAEHWHPYGISSKPKPGAEALTFAVGGARDHLVVLVADRRYRLTGLEDGDVALHDDQGQVVHLKRDGILIQTEKTLRVEGKRVEIAATEAVHIGAGGVGPSYTPTQVTLYTQGIPPSTVPPLEVESR